jgi:hypothetical protein
MGFVCTLFTSRWTTHELVAANQRILDILHMTISPGRGYFLF